MCVCGCCGSVRSSTTEWLHEEEVVTEERVGEGRRSIVEVSVWPQVMSTMHDCAAGGRRLWRLWWTLQKDHHKPVQQSICVQCSMQTL